jgi:hypothetical protein
LVIHRLKRFRSLSRADRWVLLRALVWLGLIDLALRVVGFQAVLNRVAASPIPETDSPGQSDVWRARHYARWLDVASRHHVVRARCLHRSLVLHHWLNQDGIPSQLQIGVRKDDGILKAHAWVEMDGQAVNDPPSTVSSFTPLTRFRAANQLSGRIPQSRSDERGINMWKVRWQ